MTLALRHNIIRLYTKILWGIGTLGTDINHREMGTVSRTMGTISLDFRNSGQVENVCKVCRTSCRPPKERFKTS